MTEPAAPPSGKHLHATDLRGASRLAVDATLGLVGLVEQLHHNIRRAPGPLSEVSQPPTRGIAGLVYRSIRGVTRLVGGSLDLLLGQLVPLLGPAAAVATPEREAVLAALNGVLGDHLEASANPLAIPMSLRHAGRTIALDRLALAALQPAARQRVVVLVHGLCMNPPQWRREGHDHGAMLAEEGGFTALYLHYNSGLSIASNGRRFANLLQALCDAWPVRIDELVIVGHSMGGLVARSACAQAEARGDGWMRRLTKMVFLGSPHLGAPLERGGHWVDLVLGASPYTAAFARLGKLRSAGITDLRHGTLLDDVAPHTGAAPTTAHAQVPLPSGVRCFAVAGSLGRDPGALREKLLGDGLVPLDSALGRHRQAARRLDFAPDQVCIAQGAHHLELLSSPAVAAQLRAWLLPAR